jgi:hypothetical protein
MATSHPSLPTKTKAEPRWIASPLPHSQPTAEAPETGCVSSGVMPGVTAWLSLM